MADLFFDAAGWVGKTAKAAPKGAPAKVDPLVTVGTKKIRKSQYKALQDFARDNKVALSVVLAKADIPQVRNAKFEGHVIGLNLTGNKSIVKLDALAKLPNLDKLILHNTGVTDIGPLKNCKNLGEISLSGTGVKDLSSLRTLRNLEIVCLVGMKKSNINLSPLAGSKNLIALYISGGTSILSLTPLDGLLKLRWLGVKGTKIGTRGITQADITALNTARATLGAKTSLRPMIQ